MTRKKLASSDPPPTAAGFISSKSGMQWWVPILAVVLGVVIGYIGARVWFADKATERYDRLKTEFDVTAAQYQYDLNAARARVDSLQGQLAVEESTRKGLEGTLQSTQNDLAHARDQLAFFDQLLPPGPNGAISVRALDIKQRGPILQYRVLLMRNAPGSANFNGLMEFVARGTQNGKTVKIKLEPVQAATGAAKAMAGVNELALNFDQFQRSGGVLSVPEGFIPKTVTLNILEGTTVRISRTVNLSPDN